MIVRFVTDGGSRYTLDHRAKQFIRKSPDGKKEEGPLWNLPQVVKGKRVMISTKPHGRGVVRVIQTGIVRDREVVLD